MSWRVANSLETLKAQIDTRFPGRDIAADGSIGDAAHLTRGNAGDHNPWFGPGIVTARDFTHAWGTGVNVRAQPRPGAPVVAVQAAPTRVTVTCQARGDRVDTAGHSNDAWAFVPALGGHVSNIFIDHPDAWLPGVGER